MPPISAYSRWLLSAVIYGSLISTFVFMMAWQRWGNLFPAPSEQVATWSELRHIHSALSRFQIRNGRPPASLEELSANDDVLREWRNDDSQILDRWAYPFQYAVKGKHAVVISYGRDGKPGGAGLDLDQSSDDLRVPETSLRAYLEYPSTREDMKICVVAGIFSCLLFLITTGPSEYSTGFLFAPLRMLVIGILAFNVVAIMAFFRISAEAL